MSSAGGSSGPLSASAIVSPVVGSGSHILRIEGYSGSKGLGNGRHLDSETFVAGGSTWRLCYYPDSFRRKEGSDSISIALNLVDSEVDDVEASFTVSLLDPYGVPVPSYCRSNRHTFATWNDNIFEDSIIFREDLSGIDLIERSDLEISGYLKDDVFSVRCDVTVVKKAFTKAIPVSEAFRGVVKKER